MAGMRCALALLVLVGCGDDVVSVDAGFDAGADGGLDAGFDAAPPPPARPAEAPLVQWVDPFIGTGGLGYGVGSAHPGPQRPFGLARPAPDTAEPEGAPGFAHCSGYYYEDSLIWGFSQVRPHGMGVPDYGVIALMPIDGISPAETVQTGYASPFSHDREEASVGYYAVTLDATGARVELTATDRVALHRITFPATVVDPTVVVDVSHYIGENEIIDARIEIDDAAREVRGFSRVAGSYSNRAREGGVAIYFTARFDTPFATSGVWDDGVLAEGETTRTGPGTGGWLAFAPTPGSPLTVNASIGLSFVDEAHAEANLDAEAEGHDFDGVRADAEAAWEPLLGRAEIEGRDERDFVLFYTALYHVLSMPTLASDSDGSYRGLDSAVHVLAPGDGRYYTDFSLWDTFRTQVPLLTLLYPDLQRDLMRSLVRMSIDAGGYMPRWPLGTTETGGTLGESATIAFSDAWSKGVRDYDLRAAYDAMRRTATAPLPSGVDASGRFGVTEYMELGYVSIETGGRSASWTLESAYDDWALARLARALGEDADATMFDERAGYYRNLFDPVSELLIGRHRDGSFPVVERPDTWQDWYYEGNPLQYSWYAPHDLEGLAELMGGVDATVARLEQFFMASARGRPNPAIPATNYWHGNEPDLHAGWIFSALDRPDGTERWTRWIVRSLYNETPAGLPGNDDSGTLSAWLAFAMAGFFPIAGADFYLLGSPVLTRVVLHLPGGDFEVRAPDASESVLHVATAMLDGTPLVRPRFEHAEIADGAVLDLTMR